jgi:hypothetical protein
LDTDGEAFDCATCEVRERESAVTEHDHLALRVYGLLQTSAVRDLRLTPLVFDVLQLRLSMTDAVLLLEKLDVIHQHATTRAPADTGDGDDRG